MAQGAVRGHSARDDDGDVQSNNNAANQSRKGKTQRSPISDVGRVSSTFGYRLDEPMQAYSGVLNEFGCPGNTVDQWRVQFIGRESSLRAANGRTQRK